MLKKKVNGNDRLIISEDVNAKNMCNRGLAWTL